MRVHLALLALCLTCTTSSVSLACTPVKRSAAVLRAFRKTHPCPATGQTTGACPGWVIDHGLSLCLTGPQGDVVYNLSWQSVEDAKKKDVLEKALCRQMGCAHRGD